MVYLNSMISIQTQTDVLRWTLNYDSILVEVRRTGGQEVSSMFAAAPRLVWPDEIRYIFLGYNLR